MASIMTKNTVVPIKWAGLGACTVCISTTHICGQLSKPYDVQPFTDIDFALVLQEEINLLYKLHYQHTKTTLHTNVSIVAILALHALINIACQNL